MAFVSRAVDALAAGGAFGVLLPSSLLTLQAAEDWRNDLLERTDLRLLASLGDYGLFAHALVQVAAAVMSKPRDLCARQSITQLSLRLTVPKPPGTHYVHCDDLIGRYLASARMTHGVCSRCLPKNFARARPGD